MTREEAIKYFKRHLDLYCVDGISREAEEMAIQALKQNESAEEWYKLFVEKLDEQEPTDAISREAALEKMADYVASGYADSAEDFEEYSRIICQLPPVTQKSGKWIPVSERLPENAKHKGAFCPKYYVMTEFGQTEGWYNPDVGCWYVLLWFMDARFETWNISLERGDVPKLVKNVPVTAWMPLPEPYEPQEGANE